MANRNKTEIIRDNRVARLLWFTLGFTSASLLVYFMMKYH
ncbi:hypothetical protein FLCH110379_12935 [Flavobacterium chungbukense]